MFKKMLVTTMLSMICLEHIQANELKKELSKVIDKKLDNMFRFVKNLENKVKYLEQHGVSSKKETEEEEDKQKIDIKEVKGFLLFSSKLSDNPDDPYNNRMVYIVDKKGSEYYIDQSRLDKNSSLKIDSDRELVYLNKNRFFYKSKLVYSSSQGSSSYKKSSRSNLDIPLPSIPIEHENQTLSQLKREFR